MQENQTTENTQDANNVPKKTKAQIIKALQSLYREQGVLDEDIKALKDEAKDAGYNAPLLASVAKSLAQNKTDEILEKHALFAQVVEEFDDAE